jgi:hypothetical protein
MRLSQFEDEGTYQIDLIVTLFAILLVFLLINVSALALSEATPSRFEMRAAPTEKEPFMLRSFDVRYRTRAFWVVREGQIAELDTGSLARLWVENSSGLAVSETVDAVDLRMTQDGGNTVDGFDVQLLFFGEAPMVPGRLWRWVEKPSLDEATLARLAAAASGAVLIYSWHQDRMLAFALEREFRRQRRPVDLFVLPPDEKDFRIGRDRRHFGLEAVLRPF